MQVQELHHLAEREDDPTAPIQGSAQKDRALSETNGPPTHSNLQEERLFNQSHISYAHGDELPNIIVEGTGQLQAPTNFSDQEGGQGDEEANEFDKSAIIKKSLDTVMQRAELQASIRQSKGHFYDHVKSKVARCLKVQKKIAKANKKKQYAVEDTSEQAQLSKALSVEPYGLKFGTKSGAWVDRAREAIKPREQEIKEKEQQMEELQARLRQKGMNSNSPKAEKVIKRLPSPAAIPVPPPV